MRKWAFRFPLGVLCCDDHYHHHGYRDFLHEYSTPNVNKPGFTLRQDGIVRNVLNFKGGQMEVNRVLCVNQRLVAYTAAT